MNGIPAAIVIRQLMAAPSTTSHRSPRPRGLGDGTRTPYAFVPGEPDDHEAGSAGKNGVLGLLAAYLLTIALVVAASWIFGTDVPSSAGLP